ncbi:hypothetical protein ACMA1I_15770 [Pontibacter sp. 13R65]
MLFSFIAGALSAHGRGASSLAIAAAFPPAFAPAQAAARAAPDLTRRLKPKTGTVSIAYDNHFVSAATNSHNQQKQSRFV